MAPKDNIIKTAIASSGVVAPPIRIVRIEPPDMEGYSPAPVSAGMNYSTTGEVDRVAEEYVYTVWDTHCAQVSMGMASMAPTKLPVPRRLGQVRRSAKVGAPFGPIELHEGTARAGDRWVRTMSLR